MPVYINKYTGNNYFQSRKLVDKLVLNTLPVDGLPVFRYETEDQLDPGSFRSGDFDIKISLLQQGTSQLRGLSIRDFFLGDEGDFYYLVILKPGGSSFSGIAKQSQLSADYTYNQNRYDITLTCKDILIEWSRRCDAVANSTIQFVNGEQLTFESYMQRHFEGLTGGIVTVRTPVKKYVERLRELYSNIQWCYALGDYRNFITGQESISRWETFKELAKGLGFNFEMYVNPGTEEMSEPEIIFNIFFLADLAAETPLQLEVIEHKEIITPPKLEWLYLKYRSFSLNEAEYSDGIFFSNAAQYGSDTDHGDGVTLYPTCALTLGGRLLSYINENNITEKTVVRGIDFRELELKQYGYNLNTGRPIGKLYPLNEANGGGMAYARIFNCARVHGGVLDFYDFVPIQEYCKLNYRHYVNLGSGLKCLEIQLPSSYTNILWKVVSFDADNLHYVSSIESINFNLDSATIQLSTL
ncbi:MAG: hypothetical protein IAE90_07265 [Ignavibacteria bacterium]|nr:hypothetical protein [Ignavibacteria bacterium]